MSLSGLSAKPFSASGFNTTSTPIGPGATAKDVHKKFKRVQKPVLEQWTESDDEYVTDSEGAASDSESRETKYVDNNNWPSDSPAAGVYDIRNTSAKMVIYNNKRPSTSNRLRGYSDNKIPREPSPNRHLPNLVHKKNPERHTDCATSMYPPYEYDNRMSWPVRDPNQQYPEGSGADPNRHTYCHIDPEMLKFLRLHGPVRAKQVLARTPPDNLSAEEYRFLQHPQLSNSERRYLSSVASVYSTSKMKTIKQNQYRNLLRKQLRLGFASAAEYEKYMRYLEGPRMTQPGNQSNHGTEGTSKNKKSEPLLSRRRAAQEGKGTKNDAHSGPSPYAEDQARGVNEPAAGRETPAGRRKKSGKRRDPDAPRPHTAPGGGAPRGLKHGWGENDMEGRRPTPRKSEFAFLQAVTAEAEADDEAEEEYASSRHAGHISVDSVSEAGSTQSALPHPPQTPREGYGRPRSRLGRKKPQTEEIEDDEQIPEDADNNQDNSLVLVIENGSVTTDAQTAEENKEQSQAKEADAKAVQTGDEDEPEVRKDIGTSLSDFKAFLASQKKSAEMVETGTSMEDERAARRERRRKRREQRAKQAEELRQLNMSGVSVTASGDDREGQVKVVDNDGTSVVSTETATSTLVTSETTTSSEQQVSKPDHPDPDPKDIDSVSMQTQTEPASEPKDAPPEEAEVEYPVMQVTYREPQREPEIVQEEPRGNPRVSAELVVERHITADEENTKAAEAESPTAPNDPAPAAEEPQAPEVLVNSEAVQQDPIPDLKLDVEQTVEVQADMIIEQAKAEEEDASVQVQSEGQEKLDEPAAAPVSAPAAAPEAQPTPAVNANINASLISLNSSVASPRPIESSRPFSPFQEDPIEGSDFDEVSVDVRIESPDPVDTTGVADITSPPGPPTPEPLKAEVEASRTETVVQADVVQAEGVQRSEDAVIEQKETVVQGDVKEIDSGEEKQEVVISDCVQVHEPKITDDKIEEGSEAVANIVSEQNEVGSTEGQVRVEVTEAKVEMASEETVAKVESEETQIIEEVKKDVIEAVEIEKEKVKTTDSDTEISTQQSEPEETQNENQDVGEQDVSRGVLTVQDISITSQTADKVVESEPIEEQKESTSDKIDVVEQVSEKDDDIFASSADTADQKQEKADEKDESKVNALEAMIIPSAPLAEELVQVTETEQTNVKDDVKQSAESETIAEAAEKTETTQAEPSEPVQTEDVQEDVVLKVDATAQLTGKDGNPHMQFEEQSEKAENVTESAEKSEPTEADDKKGSIEQTNIPQEQIQEEVVAHVPEIAINNTPETINKNAVEEVDERSEVKEETMEQSIAPPIQTPEESSAPQVVVDNTPQTISKNVEDAANEVNTKIEESKAVETDSPQITEEASKPEEEVTQKEIPEPEQQSAEGNAEAEKPNVEEEVKVFEQQTQQTAEADMVEEKPSVQEENKVVEQVTADIHAEEEKQVAETVVEQQVVSEETAAEVVKEQVTEPVESSDNCTKGGDEASNVQQEVEEIVQETAQTINETRPQPEEEKSSDATVESTSVVDKVEGEVQAESQATESVTITVDTQGEVQEATQTGEKEAKGAVDEVQLADNATAEQQSQAAAIVDPESDQAQDIAPKDEDNAEKLDETDVPTDSSRAESETQPTPQTEVVEESNTQVEVSEPKIEVDEVKEKEKEETVAATEVITQETTEVLTQQTTEVTTGKSNEVTMQQSTDFITEQNTQVIAEESTQVIMEQSPEAAAMPEGDEAKAETETDTSDVQQKEAVDENTNIEQAVEKKPVEESSEKAAEEEVESAPQIKEDKSAHNDVNKDGDQPEIVSQLATSASNLENIEMEEQTEVEAEDKVGDTESEAPEHADIQVTQAESDVASESDKDVKTEAEVSAESAKQSQQEADAKTIEEQSHAPIQRKISLTVPDNEAPPQTFEGDVKTQENIEVAATTDDTLAVEGPGERTRRPSITVNSPEGEIIEQVLNQSAEMTKDDLGADEKEEGQQAIASEADKEYTRQDNQVAAEEQKVSEESANVESNPADTPVANGNIQPSVDMHEDDGLNSTTQEAPKELVNMPLTNGNVQPSVEMHEDEGLDIANGQSSESSKADVPNMNGNVQPTVENHEDEGINPGSAPVTNGNDDTQEQQSQVEEKPHVPIIKSVGNSAQWKGSDLKAKMEGKLNTNNAVAYPGR